VMKDCVDSMDGEEAHQMALTLIETCLGSVMTWDQVREAVFV
jgi:hypothetical protein